MTRIPSDDLVMARLRLPERNRWDNARSVAIWGIALAAPSLAVLVGWGLQALR